MRATYTLPLTRPDRPAVQYRRAADSGGVILRLEHRELKPDGTPHNNRFYPVSDAGLLWMQRQDGGTEIIDRLVAEQHCEDPAYAGLDVDQIADLCHRGFAGKFPELADAENNVIFRARAAGFGSCFPAYPTAEAQARYTLAAAWKWLETH